VYRRVHTTVRDLVNNETLSREMTSKQSAFCQSASHFAYLAEIRKSGRSRISPGFGQNAGFRPERESGTAPDASLSILKPLNKVSQERMLLVYVDKTTANHTYLATGLAL